MKIDKSLFLFYFAKICTLCVPQNLLTSVNTGLLVSASKYNLIIQRRKQLKTLRFYLWIFQKERFFTVYCPIR